MIRELLSEGQPVQLRSRGGSMWPAIPSGSLVELSSCRPRDLRVGQMAAFESDGRVVVHRVESVTELGVNFVGDTARRKDGLITFDHVLGRARVLERRSIRWRLPRRSELRWLWRVLLRRLWSAAGGVRRNSGGASPPT